MSDTPVTATSPVMYRLASSDLLPCPVHSDCDCVWVPRPLQTEAQASQRGAAADLTAALEQATHELHWWAVVSGQSLHPHSDNAAQWWLCPNQGCKTRTALLNAPALRPASTPRAVEVEPAGLRVTRDALRKMHSYHHQNETLPCYVANTIAYATTLLPDPDPWAAFDAATPPARDGGKVA